jgi:hypothetical protein
VLTRNEIERLASAIHGLRPDWPVTSLVTFIARRDTRPLLDLTIELAWVAQSPDTKSPARIDEDGPWKSAVRQQASQTTALEHIDWSTACHECNQPRDNHRAPDHAWTRPQPPAPVPDNIRQLVKTKKVHP